MIDDTSYRKSTISHSEVESFLKCPRQHYYGYGLQIEQDKPMNAAMRGTIGHEGLEAFFTHMMISVEKEDEEKRFQEAQAAAYAKVSEYGGFYGTYVAEVTHALSCFFTIYPFRGWRIMGTETSGTLDITENVTMPYKLDLYIQDPYGDNWVFDAKFIYDFWTADQISLSPQLAKYLVGLRVNGFPVHKIGYLMFRYRTQKDLSPEKYFRMVEVPLRNEWLGRAMREQAIASLKIQEVKKQSLEEWSDTALRTSSYTTCERSCSYRTLCIAELRNEQPNLVLNADYKKRTRQDWKPDGTE